MAVLVVGLRPAINAANALAVGRGLVALRAVGALAVIALKTVSAGGNVAVTTAVVRAAGMGVANRRAGLALLELRGEDDLDPHGTRLLVGVGSREDERKRVKGETHVRTRV